MKGRAFLTPPISSYRSLLPNRKAPASASRSAARLPKGTAERSRWRTAPTAVAVRPNYGCRFKSGFRLCLTASSTHHRMPCRENSLRFDTRGYIQAQSNEVTQLLRQWSEADRAALDQLMPVVFQE